MEIINSREINMSISIPQHAWGYTLEAKSLSTGGFGPCHVLTAYHQETSLKLLAHIDDVSTPQSIRGIFETIATEQPDINLQDLKVTLTGGWKSHPESERWGKHILRTLLDFQITADMSFWRKKDIRALKTEEDFAAARIDAVVKKNLQKQVTANEYPFIADCIQDTYNGLSIDQNGLVNRELSNSGQSLVVIDFIVLFNEEESLARTTALRRVDTQ